MGGRERAWVTGDQACSVGRSPGHPQPGQRLPGLQPRRMGPPAPPTITRGSTALTVTTPGPTGPCVCDCGLSSSICDPTIYTNTLCH